MPFAVSNGPYQDEVMDKTTIIIIDFKKSQQPIMGDRGTSTSLALRTIAFQLLASTQQAEQCKNATRLAGGTERSVDLVVLAGYRATATKKTPVDCESQGRLWALEYALPMQLLSLKQIARLWTSEQVGCRYPWRMWTFDVSRAVKSRAPATFSRSREPTLPSAKTPLSRLPPTPEQRPSR